MRCCRCLRVVLAVVVSSLASFTSIPLWAQSFPSKPLRIVIGYTPGGAADATVRPLARVLEPLLGQPVVIEPKPGAAGGVAADFIAKVPADGYTLYLFDNGPLTVSPHLNRLGYQPFTSFTQLGMVCTTASILVVHPSAPFQSVADVIAFSKREPAKWSYGTSGIAGPHHLSGEYFKSATGAVLLHVPYKGGGPAMADLMGGQVPMMFSSLGPAVGAVKSGKIRALAVTSLKRSSAFPDVPTLDEAGVKGFESTGWFGLLGPAGMPADIVSRLSQALQKAGEDRNLQEQLRTTGCDAEFLSPAQTLERVRADHAKWGRVIREAGIKAE